VPTESAVFIHPAALCESDAVGDGTRIWAFAHVMAGARIGRDCNIGDQVFVEGGAVIGDRVTVKNGVMVWSGLTIEDDAFIGPGVIFTNDRNPRSPRCPDTAGRYASGANWLIPTRVHRGASLGAGAIIVCGVTIGAWAMVGAGAVVTRDVEPYRLVLGHPARPVGWVCRCGQRVNESFSCDACGRRIPRGEAERP